MIEFMRCPINCSSMGSDLHLPLNGTKLFVVLKLSHRSHFLISKRFETLGFDSSDKMFSEMNSNCSLKQTDKGFELIYNNDVIYLFENVTIITSLDVFMIDND